MPSLRKSSPPPPPPVMTWGKAIWVLVVCGIFDALRLMFEFFWFFAPAIAALLCTIKVGSVVGTTIGGYACGAVAAAAGAAAAAAVATFGVIMAMATGFAGWLVVGLILMWVNPRIFKENALWFAGGLLVSEIPIVGSIPAITLSVWKMYRTQIRIEEAAFKKYEEEQKAAALREQQREAARRMQLQAANASVYAQAANDAEYTQKTEKAA